MHLSKASYAECAWLLRMTESSTAWYKPALHCVATKGKLIVSISFHLKLKMFISLLALDHYPNVILKLWMLLYLCIWYFCWVLQPCFTMSRTCDHFTASEKHVWTSVSAAGVAFVNTMLQCQHISIRLFQGCPIILIRSIVNFTKAIVDRACPALALLWFFCFSRGAAVIHLSVLNPEEAVCLYCTYMCVCERAVRTWAGLQ